MRVTQNLVGNYIDIRPGPPSANSLEQKWLLERGELKEAESVSRNRSGQLRLHLLAIVRGGGGGGKGGPRWSHNSK